MAKRTVVLCDFCNKAVAEAACCVCSRDGCPACLQRRLSLTLTTTPESKGLRDTLGALRAGHPVEHARAGVLVHAESVKPLCGECDSAAHQLFAGNEIAALIKEATTAVRGRAKAAWAIKAMTGRNINEPDPEPAAPGVDDRDVTGDDNW